MSKLRPVEEVAQGLYGRTHDERIERAQADREATVEACAEAFATYIRDIRERDGKNWRQRGITPMVQAQRDRHTLLAEVDRMTIEHATEDIVCNKEYVEAIEKTTIEALDEIDRLKAELAEARETYRFTNQDAVKAERARCIAAIGASCMICPECIVEAVKVIEADA